MTTEGVSRGRRARAERRQIASVPEQRPFAQPRLHQGPTEIVSADQVEALHHASLRILRDIGMKVLDPDTRTIYARAGATIDGEMVRFDPAMVEELIVTAPAEFILPSTLPEKSLPTNPIAIELCSGSQL